MKITAQQVNELRKATGAGMMDCKKALVETEGDFEKAIDYLRKKGQKVAAKRADREAKEGAVIAKVSSDGSFGALVMINCETDFVAKNEDFVSFVSSIAEKAADQKINSTEALLVMDLNGRTVEQNITDQTGVIGEKIELGAYECISADKAFAYTHPGNRLASILGLNKSQVDGIEQVGKELAMQVAAMDPVAIDESDVPQELIDREKEIGMEQARQEGKPENMLEKIAMGKVQKFLKESTLLNQAFIRDNKKTVNQYLKEVDKDLKVNDFKRVMLAS